MFQPLLIACYNTHWACCVDGVASTERIAKAISAHGSPDVICFQEVSVGPTGLQGLEHGPNQVAEYLTHFPEHTAFFAPTLSRSVQGIPAHFGNLTLTRLPVSQVRYQTLPSPACEAGKKGLPRNVIATTLSQGELYFTVLNTHLEYESASQRMAQIEFLRCFCEQLQHRQTDANSLVPHAEDEADADDPKRNIFSARTAAGPVVLCGDLNATPDSQELSTLCNGIEGLPETLNSAWALHDHPASQIHTVGLHARHGNADHAYCCDYFILSEGLIPHLVESWVDATPTCSDHQPIYLRLNTGSLEEAPVFL